MLLEAAAAADPAAAAGTAFGSFLAGLAGSGPIGALIAAGLAGLVVIESAKLVREVRRPAASQPVNVGADIIEAAADRVGLAGRAADAECKALAERVEAIENWRTEHDHQHALAKAIEEARAEGARAEREHTNPGRRR